MKGRSTYYCSRYKRFHMFPTVSIGVLHDKWLRSLLYPMLLLGRVYPSSGHLGQLQGLASIVISSSPLESRLSRGRTNKSGPCVLVERTRCMIGRRWRVVGRGENYCSWDVYAQKNRHFACNASRRWLKMDSAPSDYKPHHSLRPLLDPPNPLL